MSVTSPGAHCQLIQSTSRLLKIDDNTLVHGQALVLLYNSDVRKRKGQHGLYLQQQQNASQKQRPLSNSLIVADSCRLIQLINHDTQNMIRKVLCNKLATSFSS